MSPSHDYKSSGLQAPGLDSAPSPTSTSNEQHPVSMHETATNQDEVTSSTRVSEAEHIARRDSPTPEAGPHDKAAHQYQHQQPRGDEDDHSGLSEPTQAAPAARDSPIPRAGRGPGPARYGGMGEAGLRDAPALSAQQEAKESQASHASPNQDASAVPSGRTTRDRGLSKSHHKSFTGGPNQSFMHFINALAQDEGRTDIDSAEADKPQSPEQARRRPWYEGGGVDETTSEDTGDEDDVETPSDSDSSQDEDEQHRSSGYIRASRKQSPGKYKNSSLLRQAQSQSASISGQSVAHPIATTLADSTSSSSVDNEDEPHARSPPRSFLASINTSNLPPKSAEDVQEDLSASSSIHAIHRPIAARKRTLTGEPGEAAGQDMYIRQSGLGMSPTNKASDRPDLRLSTSEARRLHDGGAAWSRNNTGDDDDTQSKASTKSRSGTIDSVQRRNALAEKLGDVFGLDGTEDVIAEFPCWLFRSVLLQGFAFITTGHICFYAYLQKKEGSVVRSGALSNRGAKTRRYYKHWFVLKDDVLSWFPSSTDPYFPDGHIDLHYCTAVEPSSHHKHHFKVSTAEKKWHFSADSEASRDEWVKTIKKAIFRAQNEGESVRIAIPLETVIDIEKSAHLDFAETIRIRVADPDEGYSVEDYWLAYLNDMDLALEKMNAALDAHQQRHAADSIHTLEHIQDTTEGADRVLSPPGSPQTHAQDSTGGPIKTASSLSQRLSNLGSSTSSSSSSPQHRKSTLSRILHPGSSNDRASASTTTLTDTEKPARGSGSTTPRHSSEIETRSQNERVGVSTIDDHDHRYPPAPVPGSTAATSSHTTSSGSGWNPLPAIGSGLAFVPRKIMGATGLSGHSQSGSAAATTGSEGGQQDGARQPRRIREVVTGTATGVRAQDSESHDTEDEDDSALPVDDAIDGHDETRKERHMNAKFRKTFGLADKEKVVAHWPAYLFRGIPISGKLYMSTSYVCFKSGLLAKTRMILPLVDIIGVEKHRSFRIGYSGLILTIKGHEELFLELSSTDRRDEVLAQIEQRSDLVSRRAEVENAKKERDDQKVEDREHQQHIDLIRLALPKASEAEIEDRFDGHHSKANLGEDVTGPNAHPPPETMPGQPPVMFCSTSSDFVTFRPEKSLKFTCLTIGSRGDVQPYIALCKGLMAEGHTCKITSHAEYREWVEGHDIEFEAVGGDPGDLMQLMIAHDFFTISFMKEAVDKFRSWLDDLLVSAWKACQDSDVLIESPSAMAGYHIAEALQIPYYRAFTMPWTRTRAYPHAFAVPDVKMGGSYNYMTYTMFDQVFWRATSGQINRWRKKYLKIAPTNFDAMQQHKIPFLYNFSPVVIPPPLDWRENIHVTGYWWLDNPDNSKTSKWEPPKDLLEFLDKAKENGKKVVFIGFGSIIIPDPVQMTRTVTEAVEKADVYAIIAKGWSDRNKSDDDSKEDKAEAEKQEKKEAEILEKEYIFNVKTVPHDWLFPKIDAAVHHGGAGTTGASLRAGLPTIIKPFFGDQHFYADRVQTLGIGSAVKDLTVDKLAEALTKACHDEKQIAKAKLAGEQIRKEDGVGNAIEAIYRDLEYARSLIPALTEAPPSSSRTTTSTTVDTQQSPTKLTRTESETQTQVEEQDGKGSQKGEDRQHKRSESSRTNPSSSDEGSWAVVSSHDGRGEGDDHSSRWDEDSVVSSAGGNIARMGNGGDVSRSRSRTRSHTAATDSDDHEDPRASTVKHGKKGSVGSHLTTAVLEAFGKNSKLQ